MKKLTIILISAIVLLSISAVAIFALTSGENDAPIENAVAQENIEVAKPSAFETLTSVITSENDTFAITKFNQKEIFADISRDNMREIFNSFDIVLEKNDTIELKDTMYHRELLNHENIEYLLTNDIDLEHIYRCVDNGEQIVLNHDGKIIVSTDQDPDVLKYAMFTSVYMELFPNNWTYGYTQEQLNNMNDSWIPLVKVIPDYAEYGFDSAFEAFQSFSGRTSEQFTFKRSASFSAGAIKDNKEMNKIMENSEDSYLLEYFFYNLSEEKELNESNDFAMIKKSEIIK